MTLFRRYVLALVAALTLAAPQFVQAQAFTDYAENKITDALLRNQAIGTPATWYIALDTTACSDSAAGTEVTGGSYARASFTPSLTSWSGTLNSSQTVASTGTGGVSSNLGTLSFPTPTAPWGTVTHWRLVDAPTGGNTWICAALTASQTISTGNTVSFAVNSLSVTVQ